MEPETPHDAEESPGNDAALPQCTALVVALSNDVFGFQRLIIALSRKHIRYGSLVSAGHRVIVYLAPDGRNPELLASIVRREPTVIRVDICRLEEEIVHHFIDELLTHQIDDGCDRKDPNAARRS